MSSDERSLKSIAIKAEGSLRDALSLLDKVITLCEKEIKYSITKDVLGIVDRELYFNILETIFAKESGKSLNLINITLDSGISISYFFDGFISYI